MFQMIATGFKQFGKVLLAIVAPMIAWKRAECTTSRFAVATIHVVGMLLGLCALSVLQWFFSLDHYMRSSSWVFRSAWLPIVASMIYALAWSLWYLVNVLRSPEHTERDSELHAAWKQAKDRIARAGIDLRRTPLFLTLGRPTGGVHNFFSAAGFPLAIPPTPADDDAPLRICGNHDALFLCCDRSSLLDEFVTRLARRQAERDSVSAVQIGSLRNANETAAHIWGSPSTSNQNDGVNIKNKAAYPGGVTPTSGTAVLAKPTTITEQHPVIAKMESQFDVLQKQIAEAETVIQPTCRTESLVELETQLAAEIDERLQGICRLLAEDREPFCPINGVVLLVPIDATDNAELADHVGMRIEHDLTTIVRSLQMGVSIQLVLTGLERCVGTKAMLARFPKTQRDRRLGAVIPIAPASEPESEAKLLDQTSQWLCNDLFPPLVARLLNRDGSDEDADFALQQGNLRLHQFTVSMRDRQGWLSRMMRRIVASQQGNLRLRGCFFAATGDDAMHGQAFAAGIVPMILGCQNEVRWLEGRRRRDYWQWVSVLAGYACIAAATLGMLSVFLVN